MTILFFLCQYTEDEQLGTSRSSPTRKTFFSNIERKTIRKQKKVDIFAFIKDKIQQLSQ
jgi:hypothetical protein